LALELSSEQQLPSCSRRNPAKKRLQIWLTESPWQRGSNENTNGLLRQYLPKKADLSRFSQSELDEIALRLNTRPRQTLGFRTPADKLQASVASTP
jgi:IS30 family transposase